MSNNRSGQNRIFTNFFRLAKIILGKKSIQLVALILTLIATVATKEVRNCIGLGDVQEDQSGYDNPTPSYAPFEYTLNEHEPLFIQNVRTSLSIIFQNFEGEEFVSLNISPIGKKSSTYAVLRGNTKKFKSSVGVVNVQILNIDYDNRKVVLQVSPELQ